MTRAGPHVPQTGLASSRWRKTIIIIKKKHREWEERSDEMRGASTEGEKQDKMRTERTKRCGGPTKNDEIFKETKTKADKEEEQRRLLPPACSARTHTRTDARTHMHVCQTQLT